MSQFSVPQAAFSGYRLLRDRPVTGLIWFAFYLAVTVFTVFATVTMAGPQLAALQEMQASGSPDPTTAMTLTGQLMPYYAFSMLFPLVIAAIAGAAVSRSVLRPAEGAPAYLRFGGDELRLLVVTVVIFILFFVTYLLALAMGIVGLFASAGPGSAGALLQGRGSVPPQTIAIAAATALPGATFLIFLFVKLSLATPQTVAERQIRIFNSWGLTRGHFWRILGAYVLAAIPVILAGIVVLGISLAMTPGGLAGGIMKAMQPDYSSMAVAFSGAQIVSYILQAAWQTLFVVALLVPAATIYTALCGGAVEDVFGDDDDED